MMAAQWQDETNSITVGRCPFYDGSFYCGQWDQQRFAQRYGCWSGREKKGKFEGFYRDGLEITGTYTWPSGEVYHGQWSKGQRHGFGIQKYKGSVYAGYWNRGICDYLGAMWNRCGSIYFGTWQDGQKTGYGTEAYLDGKKLSFKLFVARIISWTTLGNNPIDSQ